MQRPSAALGALLSCTLVSALVSTHMFSWWQDMMRHVDLSSPDMRMAEMTRGQVVAAVAAMSAETFAIPGTIGQCFCRAEAPMKHQS
jgi:hypothetical protein